MARVVMPRKVKNKYAVLTLDRATGEMLLRTHFDVQFKDHLLLVFRNDRSARRWDPPHWRFDALYTDEVVACVKEHLGFDLEEAARQELAASHSTTAKESTRTFTLDYIGAARHRGTNIWSAYGMIDGHSGWDLEVGLDVLKRYFHVVDRPSSPYAVLGIPRSADEGEIKRGYRRAARAWHPDVCRESDATARFVAIGRAYELLKDPLARRKYDAAQAFVGSLDISTRARGKVRRIERKSGGGVEEAWMPPVRCGKIRARVVERMGRIRVLEILEWEDQARGRDGAVRVTTWTMDRWTEDWRF